MKEDNNHPTGDEELLALRDEVARLRRAESLKQPGEEQRRADEALTRGILDSVVVGVMQFAKDGRVVYANAYARRMLGFIPKEQGELFLADFEPWSIWPNGTRCLRQDYPSTKCLATGRPQGPTTIGVRRENGETLWVAITVVPVLDPDTGQPESAIATFIDVTHPMRMEESLHQSEDRYGRLVEQAPEAIIVHRDNALVYVNDGAVKLWGGQSRADLLGRNVLDFVHPRYRARVRLRIEQARRGTTLPLLDQLHVRLDGGIVHVEVVGTSCIYDGLPSVQAIMRDVTERKRAERQVRRQREILKKFFDRIPVLVGFFDVEGRTKLINREWRRVLGWPKEFNRGDLLAACFPDDPQARESAVQYIAERPPGWRDFQVRVADGRTLDMSWANIELSDGTRIHVGQDVTEQRQAARDLRQHKELLEQRVRERTEELTRKNAELQIEIAERRKAEFELQDKQRFLERMLSSHERERQLVAYEMHDTFLQDVIGAVMLVNAYHDDRMDAGDRDLEPLDQAQKLLRKSIDEARRMISGLRPPIIDEQGIVAAIEYLLSEANGRGLQIEFTHDMDVERLAPLLEGTIFRIVQEGLVNVERHSQSPSAAVDIQQLGDKLQLEVRDFGVGFDPSQIGQGHFGLQGIQERTRLVGGTTSIVSAPGKGTQIVVEIPLGLDRVGPPPPF